MAERARRRRQGDRRRVYLSVTDGERELLDRAAEQAGLTVAAYSARAALSLAGDQVQPPAGPERQLLVELNQARTQVVRIGTNLNQAVRVANAQDHVPPHLADAAARAADAAETLVLLAGKAVKSWGARW